MTASVVVPLADRSRPAVQPPVKRPADSPLAQARAARGWSQLQVIRSLMRLAAHWGWPVASETSLKVQLSRWENGANEPSQTYQVLLCAVLRATPAELGFGRAACPAAPLAGEDTAALADRVQALETLVIQLSARLGAVVA
ncbi:XRE family transcriptional regulator [Streptomyces spinoverrucosus]|uniref:XRE family transcriptional regulator n=1 Tax=Streptomyces spinoverrucosus TaxID=284043 RepID=UPI0018C389A2|nr:XRE family transcriptional regulator [Streptomyces spinoverrucosus]MBG0854621.1 XRE family transcriptional regulator [Streptomyces spinoverrucosus]